MQNETSGHVTGFRKLVRIFLYLLMLLNYLPFLFIFKFIRVYFVLRIEIERLLQQVLEMVLLIEISSLNRPFIYATMPTLSACPMYLPILPICCMTPYDTFVLVRD